MLFLLWSCLFFLQVPGSDEEVLKQLEEFEKLDCEKMYEMAKKECLAQCSMPDLKSSGEEAVRQCKKVCNGSFDESMVKQCKEAQKGIKGLSTKERRELLKEDPEKTHAH